MPVATSESKGNISRKHPVCRAFAECSGYYDFSGYDDIYECLVDAINVFDNVLQGWPFHLDSEAIMGINIWGGAVHIPVYDERGRRSGTAYFEWSGVSSDGFEVTGRIGKRHSISE